LASAAPVGVSPAFPGLPSGSGGYVNGSVLFNGVNPSGATTISKAIATSWTSKFSLNYSWTSRGGKFGNPVSIAQGIMQVIYFGTALATRTQVQSPPITSANGHLNMTSSFSQYQYLFEGLIAVTVSLQASNGSTAWQESFYVHVTQPFHIVAVNVVLIALFLYELYAIATAGKAELPEKEPSPPKSPEEKPPESTIPPPSGGTT
jgi:hypothetical protein